MKVTRSLVVSNQAGVAKGLYSKQKLAHITRNMIRDVKATGGKIKEVFYCTHFSHAGCECRKPEIGSIREALELSNATLQSAQKAFFVGDTESDILTGHNAGCTTIFVLSGREDRRHMRSWEIKPDYVARDLLEATDIINERKSSQVEEKKTTGLNRLSLFVGVQHKRNPLKQQLFIRYENPCHSCFRWCRAPQSCRSYL